MAENDRPTATPADIQALGEKLEQFRQRLPPGEQAALAWLIQRAAMGSTDSSVAQGYAIVFQKMQGGAGSEQQGARLPFQFETTWGLGEPRP